ncbi:hypothetical protein BBK14_03280 [Parafrankia soli]|uniref:Uncharacterized protein n=1 Tax=Parafrankia soli TaxID=2599596 RepID=A0A1S1Q3N3_9ACTN|nr:hypothetical protein BBK14_03280 [Parafrankia soli]
MQHAVVVRAPGDPPGRLRPGTVVRVGGGLPEGADEAFQLAVQCRACSSQSSSVVGSAIRVIARTFE